jgi:alpha-tubulin suppressor-like RCC1 family protein
MPVRSLHRLRLIVERSVQRRSKFVIRLPILLTTFVIWTAFAISTGGDTYSAWKSRVFSAAEQADPAISGELAASPAGDGIPNLLKYAFDLDPHQDGSFGLPQPGLVQVVDPLTGQITYPAITHRISSSDPPTDLYFVPEMSLDLQTWVRGDSIFAPSPLGSVTQPDGVTFVTYQALSPIAADSKIFLRMRVLEGQTLPDDWQISNFGQTGIDPGGDADGDGRSNFDEFAHGTDPNDYYDGRVPVLEIVGGDGQRGFPSHFLPFPLVVRVTFQGDPLTNAPVELTVASGDAQLSVDPGLASSDAIEVRTDETGQATAYVVLGAAPRAVSTIAVQAGAQIREAAETSLGALSAKVVAGGYHSLELDGDGTVWAWGENSEGQLGDGTDVSRSLPFQIPFLSNVMDIVGGPGHSVVVESDGSVWAWGANWYGQLGAGTIDQHFVPNRVPSFGGAIAVGAGHSHTIVLRADGTVWAWGYNGEGELGNNSTNDSLVPVEVVTESGDPLTGVIAISAGKWHNLAIKSDGTLWAWGWNWDGQLGDGTYTDRHFAVQVSALSNVVAAKAGGYHSIALGDGTAPGRPSSSSSARTLGNEAASPSAWAWGYNGYAELGNNTDDYSNVPIPVAGLQDIVDLAAGEEHNLALRSDGTVLGWGRNDSGEATGEVTAPIATPVMVPNLPAIMSIASGGSHSLALASNGLIYTWGDNDSGQLGIGTQVGALPPTPTFKDGDHNGFPDFWEIQYFGQSGVDGYGDDDNDGLTNAQEYELGTDPLKSDTDGDGVVDGADGWPTFDAISSARVPKVHYLVLDITGSRIMGINNSPDGLVYLPVDAPDPPFDFYRVGDRQLYVRAFSDDDQIVGSFIQGQNGVFGGGLPWPQHGFRWYDNPILPMGEVISFGGTGIDSAAMAINTRGQILLVDGRGDEPNMRVLLWENGAETHIGETPPFYVNSQFCLNNHGVAVAQLAESPGASTVKSFIWKNDSLTALPGVARGLSDTAPDNTEMVVGSYDNDTKPYIWRKGNYYDLPPGPDQSTTPWQINIKAQVVGFSQNFGSGWLAALLWQNGKLEILDDVVGMPDEWHFQTAVEINDAGMILASAIHYPGTQQYADARVLVIPVDLLVDGNRDGQMSTTDALIHDGDITTGDTPYRFWLNDDDDTELNLPELGGNPTEAEKVPAPRPDSSLHQIVSKRNLEDFARLWIYIGGRQDAIVSGEIQVGLRWKNVVPGTAPAINIYPSFDGEGSDDYVKDEAAAQNQISDVFGSAVTDTNNKNTVDTNGTFIFKSDYWNGLTSSNPKKCLLFEGAGEGKGELEIVFFDQTGTEIGHGGSLWLDLKNIKKMYQRFDSATAHPWETVTFDPDPNEENVAIVFVHGWRMSPESAGNYAETMFKRVWHRGFKGRFAAFHCGLASFSDRRCH